ncbi:MAG TPA: MFS transporter [Acidimicrobiales bacterium]|nr:MFS transporter [Acidimicrobiales bacterium]
MHYPPRLDRRFWRIWTAAGISSLGDGMVLVAFPLLALSYTRQPVLIAGVAVAGTLPWLLIGLPAGALADRINRRKLMVGIETARLGLLGLFGALVLSGRSNLAVLYGTVFLLRALGVVFDVTAGAALPTVVTSRLLFKANANLATAQTVAEEVAGQAIGGIAFALTASLPFIADAATFAASAGLLSRALPDNEPSTAKTSFMSDVIEGLRVFMRLPLLRILTGLIASFAFCQALVLSVLVLYAVQDLHMSRSGYGILLGVSAVGTAVTSLGANQIHVRIGTGWSILGAGFAAAAAYPILAFTSSPVTAGGALALESAGVIVGNISARALRQSVVPQELQGRMASTYLMVIRTSVPVGALAGGLLVTQMGVRHTFLLAGLVQLGVLGLTAPKLLAALRRQNSTVEVGQRALAA